MTASQPVREAGWKYLIGWFAVALVAIIAYTWLAVDDVSFAYIWPLLAPPLLAMWNLLNV